MSKSIVILGRQPALGIAELESLYGAENIRPLNHGAVLDIAAEDIDFKRLGGTIKTAQILDALDTSDWYGAITYLKKVIPEHLSYIEGKLTLGISVYGLEVALPKLNRDLLELKKIIKQTGKPVRIVPNKSLELNSAQVHHNKLTHKGAWELLLVKDGDKTILAQTLFVQDIEAYGARDQARPARDARVGMLPPKLAQILVNLATGPFVTSQNSQPEGVQDGTANIRVLDPFCGTGVILQEALLMGCEVLGTDIDQRMVEYSRKNLEWLVGQYPTTKEHWSVQIGDATTYKWPQFGAVASEIYLGRPLSALPTSAKLQEIVSDVNTITKKFLQNLEPQLKNGQIVALALPAWRKPNGQFIALPLLDQLTDMGYNYLDFKHVQRQDLLYFREGQTVARQLIRLSKS